MYPFKTLALLQLLALPGLLPAQSSVLEPGRKIIPYPYVREADIMWSKRVWQVIDLREKLNQTLYYPVNPIDERKSLFEIIKEGVLQTEGNGPGLTAYSSSSNDFREKLSKAEVRKIFVRTDTLDLPADPLKPDVTVPTAVNQELSAADVKQYWLQEEWFFDKQRSVLDVRIIGIMPVIEKKNEKGEVMGMAATFWVAFDDLRPLLIQQQIFNRKNDAQLLTFDDLFVKRMFTCYIIKEDNMADRMIADYKGANTLAALLEAESIKNGILFKESDMWQH
jgi:gliding motility associated protien GldN